MHLSTLQKLFLLQQVLDQPEPIGREIDEVVFAFFDEVGLAEGADDGVDAAVVEADGTADRVAVKLLLGVAFRKGHLMHFNEEEFVFGHCLFFRRMPVGVSSIK